MAASFWVLTSSEAWAFRMSRRGAGGSPNACKKYLRATRLAANLQLIYANLISRLRTSTLECFRLCNALHFKMFQHVSSSVQSVQICNACPGTAPKIQWRCRRRWLSAIRAQSQVQAPTGMCRQPHGSTGRLRGGVPLPSDHHDLLCLQSQPVLYRFSMTRVSC